MLLPFSAYTHFNIPRNHSCFSLSFSLSLISAFFVAKAFEAIRQHQFYETVLIIFNEANETNASSEFKFCYLRLYPSLNEIFFFHIMIKYSNL